MPKTLGVTKLALYSQTFTSDSTFTVPAQVSRLTVTTLTAQSGFDAGTKSDWARPGVHANTNNAFFVDAYNRAWATGDKNYLGDNTGISKSSPVLVVGGFTWKKVGSLVQGSVYGLTTSGQLYGWGANSFGQLGIGDYNTTWKSSPTLLANGLPFSDLPQSPYAGGNPLYAALSAQGKIYTWNTGDYSGAQGDGTTATRSTPTLIAGGQDLTFRYFRYCDGPFGGGGSPTYKSIHAITDDGKIYAWGTNNKGQLGDGTSVNRSSPVLVVGGLTWKNFYTTTTNYNSSMSWPSIYAIASSGQLYAWGPNDFGRLGDGTTIYRSSPVLVAGGVVFKEIYPLAATNTVYGLTESGQLYGWGFNGGTLGVGDTLDRSSPTLVAGDLVFKDFFASNTSRYGLTTTGQLYAWGTNNTGALGVGDTVIRSSPTLVAGGLTWQYVFPANNPLNSYGTHVRGITTSGKLYAWGSNSQGLLGDGTSVDKSSPILILGNLNFIGVQMNLNYSGGGDSIFAITTSGQMWGWGSNGQGLLGNNTWSPVNQSSPTVVLGNLPLLAGPASTSHVIDVVPGSTVVVSLGPTYASFGNRVLSQGPVDQIQISY